MNNKTVIISLLVLVAILGGLWWSLAKDKNQEQMPIGENGTTDTSKSLTVDHYFNNGQHTIEGTITLPTPCHGLSHEVIMAQSFPEQVTINFTTKANDGICTQVLADKFFRVTFAANKDAIIKATLDGEALELIFGQNKEGITK